MSNWALVMTGAFIIITLAISYHQKVKLEKEILIGAVRAALQLTLIGYVLLWVFGADSWLFIGLMVLIMIAVATQNAAKRGAGIKKAWLPIAVALTSTELFSIGLMLALGILKPSAKEIIPVSGMIIGNAMVVSGLFINRLLSEVKNRRGEVLEILSYGATARQSLTFILRDSVKAGMIPTIDAMKTMGLVQLPGMMTGLILAGADPLQAVKYQILIVFALTSTAALTTLILGRLIYPRLFNVQQQLLPL